MHVFLLKVLLSNAKLEELRQALETIIEICGLKLSRVLDLNDD